MNDYMAALAGALNISDVSRFFRREDGSGERIASVEDRNFTNKILEFVEHTESRRPNCYYASGAGKSFLLTSHGRP